jgi:hypothetical protein
MGRGRVALLQLPVEIEPVTLILGQEIGTRPTRLHLSQSRELEVLGEALLKGEALKLARLLVHFPGVEGFIARQ